MNDGPKKNINARPAPPGEVLCSSSHTIAKHCLLRYNIPRDASEIGNNTSHAEHPDNALCAPEDPADDGETDIPFSLPPSTFLPPPNNYLRNPPSTDGSLTPPPPMSSPPQSSLPPRVAPIVAPPILRTLDQIFSISPPSFLR
eukprot:GHVQ01028816.1.p1 GENE.GHVQ01028816.1~~GHVQ01028816.1.p1  ORF type:complete len:143 (+),score=25.56 GHVQ01028816.1:57-485(+)